MSDAEIYRLGQPIDTNVFDVFDHAEKIIRRNHAIYGFSKGVWRNVCVQPQFDPDRREPLLGYGRGVRIEEALVRAIFTWHIPKIGPIIGKDDYAESTHGRIIPSLKDRSLLDIIAERGDVWLRLDTRRRVRAGSNLGAGPNGDETLEVSGFNVLDALEMLAEEYDYTDMPNLYEIDMLPRTLFSEEMDGGNGEDEDEDGNEGA